MTTKTIIFALATALLFGGTIFVFSDSSNVAYAGEVTNDGGQIGRNEGQSTSQTSNKLVNPLKDINSISDFLTAVITVILVFARPIAVLFIMYAGFLYVTARGDAAKLETARKALLWSIIGGVIVLGANVIMAVIEGTVKSF